jgi:hypothetical protein
MAAGTGAIGHRHDPGAAHIAEVQTEIYTLIFSEGSFLRTTVLVTLGDANRSGDRGRCGCTGWFWQPQM